MPSLQFFIYLEDQTKETSDDKLGPVTVEFYERKIDGNDERMDVRVEGGAFGPKLDVPGATRLFAGEGALDNHATGVLANSWKPWADVWVEYEPVLPAPPPPEPHDRVRKRIEVTRTNPQGNFDFFIVVKRNIGGADVEIGRSELFRNCKDDFSDLSPPGQESAIWIAVPSIGKEKVPLAPAPSDAEYERVRAAAEKILTDEGAALGALPERELEELAAQSVAGLDTIGLPPETPAKTLYDPNSDHAYHLKQHGLRLGKEAEVQKREENASEATRVRKGLLAALQAGFECQGWTRDLAKAGRFNWWVPVDPASWNANNADTVIHVAVTDIPAGTLEVPAAYFYVIGRDFEPQTPTLERYNLAAGAVERNLRLRFRQAQIRKLIADAHSPIISTAENAGAPLIHRAAARRLQGLASLDLDGRPEPTIHAEAVEKKHADCVDLFGGWLSADRTDEDYWKDFAAIAGHDAKRSQHLAIVREAVCAGIRAPGAPSFAEYVVARPGWHAMEGIGDLKAKDEDNWREAFVDYWGPTVDDSLGREQWQKLIHTVRSYLKPPPSATALAPAFGTFSFLGVPPTADALRDFFDSNPAFSITGTTVAAIQALVAPVEVIRQLLILHFLYRVVAPGAGAANPVPRMEALYFRGFIDPWPIARLTPAQFRAALIGTLAYEDANGIHARATALTTAVPLEYPEPEDDRDDGGMVERVFRPVNHDGLLTDCISADHVSPFGPAAYASALLSTQPLPGATLGAAVKYRRGPLDELHVNQANTFTPVPVIDLVNEALESLVGQAESDIDSHPNGELPAGAHPAVFQTSTISAEQLVAVPEHSTPSSPDPATADYARQTAAYDRLREDFSSFDRPYHQPLDITRTCLQHMGTSRYETMRTFRRDIHEFVKQPQDMADPKAFTPFLPPEFDTQTHLRRYPVRIETAREYLKISEEEHREIFTAPLSGSRQKLWQLWGYRSREGTGHNDTPELPDWHDDQPEVLRPAASARPAGVRCLAEFLKRSGLNYAQFRDLVDCRFVPITVTPGLPEEEPCEIASYSIDFAPLATPVALERLAVFLRLWRLLRALPHTGYSFEGVINRLTRARAQMQDWTTVGMAADALRNALQTFMDPFEKSGATPIPETDRPAASAAVEAVVADIVAKHPAMAAGLPLFAELKVRLESLVASANPQVTDDIRDLARRILLIIQAATSVSNLYTVLTQQADGLAGDITAGKTKKWLKIQARSLSLTLADFSDALISLSQLASLTTDLDAMLPAGGPTVIRQAKAKAAEIRLGFAGLPEVQAASDVASGALASAVEGWAPKADTDLASDKIESLVDGLNAALRDQLAALRLFPCASQGICKLQKHLRKLPRDTTFDEAAVAVCEEFLAVFSVETLQDDVKDEVTPIRVKIDSLPATFPLIAEARAGVQSLINMIDAVPVVDSFAAPVAMAEELIAWWAKRATQDHSFLALKQTCDVLGLYKDPVLADINSDFIRQLSAMQMLRDDYALCLSDVLPLWQKPSDAFDARPGQAKSDLARVIQERADCVRGGAKPMALRAEHFPEIEDLSSLRADGGNDSYPAFLQPTHTLRFVEICFKVAHSEFGVGELSFLYLNRHVVPLEDDPFHLESDPPALEQQPFADKFSEFGDATLLRLQKLIRGAAYGSMLPASPDGKADDGQLTWGKSEGERKWLKEKMGFEEPDLLRLDRVFTAARQPTGLWPVPSGPTGLDQLWDTLATRLSELGYDDADGLAALKELLTRDKPVFRTPLPQASVTRRTAAGAYDYDAPLSYDSASNTLSVEGLLRAHEILSEVTRTSMSDNSDLVHCSDAEIEAIRDLYEQPRRTLARFVLLLPDQREVARRLLTTDKASERMKTFIRYFFIFYRQFLVTADHLAEHILLPEEKEVREGKLDDLSATAQYLLLHHIEADENWRDNTGAFHYEGTPNAKAIAGILGLRGTGIWTEFASFKQPGPYVDLLAERFDHYVGKVPSVPVGNPTFQRGNYEQLSGAVFPPFPTFATLQPPTKIVRELSGSLNYLDHPNDGFDVETHDWPYNAPKPLRVPEPVNHLFDLATPLPAGQKKVELRGGYQVRLEPSDSSESTLKKARNFGGAVPYEVGWSGRFQVTVEGEHRFIVCFKHPKGEKSPLVSSPLITNLTDNTMRLEVRDATGTLVQKEVPVERSGPKSDMLAKFGKDTDGVFHTDPISVLLAPGHYEIQLSFVDFSVDPSVFEVSRGPAAGKDRHVAWISVYVKSKEFDTLIERIAASRDFPPGGGGEKTKFTELLAQSLFVPRKEPHDFLPEHEGAFFYPTPYYFSSIRDIRRSYQRAFKALLFCHRFGLVRDEVSFLLGRGVDFRGISFTRQSGAWEARKLDFDFNQWSVGDAFRTPAEADDVRQYPEAHLAERVWPLFDQWERLHDYVLLREHAAGAEAPLWKLFEEATDAVPAHTAADLVHRRLGLTKSEGADALLFTADANRDLTALAKGDLKTEEWPIRVWQAARWQRARERRFVSALDVPPLGYRDWARLVPYIDGLREHVNKSYLENGTIRRYRNLEELNAPLRERGRRALAGYLTSLGRCWFPHARGAVPFARTWRDLSERLLLDVETGVCAAVPRIEEASAVLRSFVQRLRLGLEAAPPDDISREFLAIWDLRLAEYRRWEAWQQQAAYPENYREADLISRAAPTEAFQFLEQQLPQLSLTIDERWEDMTPPILPAIPGFVRWEDWLPSASQPLPTHPEGYRKQTKRERTPRRTATRPDRAANVPDAREFNAMQLWSKAPLEMDERFIRVQCSTTNQQDDYYFWLVDGAAFDQVRQEAAWDWEKPIDRNDYLAGIPENLLAWTKGKTVRLAWCRIRDGVEEDIRVTDYGMPLSDGIGTLEFDRRDNDVLVLRVIGSAKADHRFVYDPRQNLAHVLTHWTVPTVPHSGGLPSFPHFIASAPGAAAGPVTFHAPALLVQKHLRLQGEREAARQWLEFLYRPLARSNGWRDPQGLERRPSARVLLLNWLETLLDIGEAQLAGNRLAATELSRETLALVRKVLGDRPRTATHRTVNPVSLAHFVAEEPPLNRRLARLWDRADLLTAAIQRCENDRPIRHARTQALLAQAPGDLPAYSNGRMPEGWIWRAEFDEQQLDHDEWLVSPPHYRFNFLLQKAIELCSEARAFGAALMSAFEKADAEAFASLRARHEVQINRLLLDVRRSQWRETDWQLQALQKVRDILELKKQHIEQLIRVGYNPDERAYFNHMTTAWNLTWQTETIDVLAQLLGPAIPEVYVGVCSMIKFVSGQKTAAAIRIGSDILHMIASLNTMDAFMDSTRGALARRDEEWRHQIDVLKVELEHVRRQILAAERRQDIALRELNIHHDTILNAEEAQSFQENKVTNAEHHLWVKDKLASLYRAMFDVAMATARDAETAFRYERHYTPARFLEGVAWKNYHEGITASDQLLMALRRMEHAYLHQNAREYELSKSISLRLNATDAMVALRLTGRCEVELPEWMFDLELPGHYCRRIKSVAITILCATGPYQAINARLTLLSDAVRVSPYVHPQYDEEVSVAGDPRLIRRYAAHQSIVTTSAQNDTGLFETDLRDARYLPFEGAGVVSRWRIEIDPATNQFHLESLSDVVLHLRYTAVDGGAELRTHAHAAARSRLPTAESPGTRYIDVPHDFPAEWLSLRERKAATLSLRVTREMFAWSRNNQDLLVNGLEIFLRPADGEPQPSRLQVKANEQASELVLVDLTFGCVYHGRLPLSPSVGFSSDALGFVQLELSTADGSTVPRPDLLIVSLKYYYAEPDRDVAPCDRFARVSTH